MNPPVLTWFINGSVWLGLLFPVLLSAQNFQILHYSETSGFDHQTRQVSYQLLEQIGLAHGFTVDHDSTGAAFSSLANLQQYAVVVFANTSGDAILNASQRSNFETYIANGGSFLGIHAASDTYRHSTANGSNTGAWDWYAELLGASVQQSPNHVAGTPQYGMDHLTSHPTLQNLPDPWVKEEEYYYWENGYYDTANVALLQVEETTGPNGQQNSYDAPRPMAWYRELPGGGGMFYTALGHAADNYTQDPDFYNHIRDGLLWTAGRLTFADDMDPFHQITVSPNPAHEAVRVRFSETLRPLRLKITDLTGRTMYQTKNTAGHNEWEVSCRDWPVGTYLVQIELDSGTITRQLVIIR